MVKPKTLPDSANLLCHIVHDLPGRLRLRVPWIKDQPQLSQQLATFLGNRPGIRECKANAECASVTLHYDVRLWSSRSILKTTSALKTYKFPRLPTAHPLS